MNLREWIESQDHENFCPAHNEGLTCCLSRLPEEMLDAPVPESLFSLIPEWARK
jgi:hypothetical protein